MNNKSEVNKGDKEAAKGRLKKTIKRQDSTRPSSIMSNSSTRTMVKTQAIRENGQFQSRTGSVSRTSFISERNVLDRDIRRDLTLHGSPAPRRTHRANSLPAACTGRYSFETKTRASAKKSEQAKRQERHDIECRSAECIFHQRMSLDLSQLSDFADSEGESRDTIKQSTKRSDSRRRRSVEKPNRIDRVSGSQIRSTSNSPSSKISASCSHMTRRSSLQSFSPRALSFASSFDSNTRLNGTYSFRNQKIRRRTSSATTLRKSSLGSSLSRHSELVFSSNSPDYTSDASTCELSPCRLSPNGVSMIPVTQKVKHDSTMSNIASNRATISPNSQIPCISSSSSCCNTSWVESEHTHQGGNGSMDGNVSESTPIKEQGEWDNFWQNYNSSLAAFPKKMFYDDCPTPFYEPDGNIDMKTFDMDPAKLEATKSINDTEKKSGGKPSDRRNVMLSKTETKEIIHCAHRLAEILTLALERNSFQQVKDKTENISKKGKTIDNGIKNVALKTEMTEGSEASGKIVEQILLADKKEEGKAEKGDKKKQELKDITVIRGDSKDVLL